MYALSLALNLSGPTPFNFPFRYYVTKDICSTNAKSMRVHLHDTNRISGDGRNVVFPTYAHVNLECYITFHYVLTSLPAAITPNMIKESLPGRHVVEKSRDHHELSRVMPKDLDRQ